MAALFTFHKVSASFFVSMVLLFCISTTTSEGKLNIGKKVTRGVAAEVCIQSRNPSFCLNVFENDPRTPYSDLQGLTSIALNHAFISLTDALNYSRNLFDSAPPELKARYELCSLAYQIAMDDLRLAGEALDNGKFGTARGYASDGCVRVNECENVFEPGMQSPLAEKNANLGDLTNMAVCAITSIL